MAKATKKTPVGFKVSLKRRLEPSKMADYWHDVAGWKGESIHSSPKLAKEGGSPNSVGQGVMILSYLSNMLAEFFGEGWVKGGWLDVAMVGGILGNDLLTWEGVVKEKIVDGPTTRLVLHVWCKNELGMTVIVGNAGGIVHSKG